MKPSPRLLRWFMNVWPPFRGAGIIVREIGADWRYARVELRAGRFKRNYVGTHFGGSLFAMTDPFWMILVMENIGRDHIVWDKRGEIEFVAPTTEPVFAEFRIDPDWIASLRAQTENGDKVLHWCETPITTRSGEVVARVRKQLYLRRKAARPDGGDAAR